MYDKLRTYIDTLFAQAPQSREASEVKEELLANLWEHFNDLKETGKNEEEAYRIVIENIGDVGELVQTLKDRVCIEGSNANGNKREEHQRRESGDSGWTLGTMIDDFISGLTSAFDLDCNVVNDQSYNSGEIRNINISLVSDSIRFYLHDTDRIRIVESMSKTPSEGELAKVEIRDGEMNVKSGNRLFFIARSRVEIYLPRNYHGDLSVKVTSSSIKFEDNFTLSHVKIKGVSCSVKGGGILSEELDIRVGSGSIKLNEMKGRYSLITESGSIQINKITGSGICKTTSGSIRAVYDKVGGDLEFASVSGSVRMFVPLGASFTYQASTVSGSVHTCLNTNQYSSSRNKVTGSVGEAPGQNVDIHVISGSVWIQNN